MRSLLMSQAKTVSVAAVQVNITSRPYDEPYGNRNPGECFIARIRFWLMGPQMSPAHRDQAEDAPRTRSSFRGQTFQLLHQAGTRGSEAAREEAVEDGEDNEKWQRGRGRDQTPRSERLTGPIHRPR